MARSNGRDLHAKDTDNTLASYGFDYRTDQGRKWATAGFEGRPDVLAVRAGQASYIEIKSAAQIFSVASWREDQRAYTQRLEAQGESIYIWLNMGSGRADLKHFRDEKYARRAFLIPVAAFRDALEKADQIGVRGIPYRIRKPKQEKRQPSVFREHDFCAASLFGSYELRYLTAGTWIIPVDHPFAERHNLKEPTCQPKSPPDPSSP